VIAVWRTKRIGEEPKKIGRRETKKNSVIDFLKKKRMRP
jgi:hypothetical protein